MKWKTISFYCLLLPILSFSQSQIEHIQLLPIKLKIVGEKQQRAYLMDIDEETISFFRNKKHLKQNLLNASKNCQTVPLDSIKKLVIPSNRKHNGKIIGGVFAGFITLIAALNPRGDGLGRKETAGIYGSYFGSITIGLGALIDWGSNNNRKKAMNPKKIILKRQGIFHFEALSQLIFNTPKAQFKVIQQAQQEELSIIISDIQTNSFMHQQRMSFYPKELPVVSGYLVGIDEANNLLLTDDLFQLVELRENPSNELKKVSLSAIQYFQIN